METQPLEKIDLPNGLNMKIYDLSRLVAGDRWFIEIKVCIPIAVTAKSFNSKVTAPDDISALQASLGDQVTFEQRFIRNFVDANAKESIVEQIVGNLKQNLQPYYSHPDFAAGYLRKQYKSFRNHPKNILTK